MNYFHLNRRLLTTFMLAASLGFLTGCQSVDSRIKENPQLFANLDAESQAKIKQGNIDLGFTEDMVYLALGAPDQKREVRSGKGLSTAWIYNSYFERYDGTRFVGYDRRLYYDSARNTYHVNFVPVYAATYRPEAEERIRVVFENGKVTVIEQTKN
ncbi:MAG: hypothetical protein Q8J74_00255 [Candidatus Didemnitutus sp.]|nr:hypothetical protein [Candidatus Didemnitutus sp.]